MSLDCCNNDCPCPVPPNTGSYWEKNYDDKCCACKADSVGCYNLTKGAEPHRVTTENTCDCECDPDRVTTTDANPDVCTDGRCEACCKLKEDNTDANGVVTDPCTPPFKFFSGDCECACDGNFDCASVDPSKPDMKTDVNDPSVCECFCIYSGGFGYATCAEVDAGKPDLRASDCSCYCALEEDENACPDAANPDILPDKCECGCLLAENPISCSDGNANLEFDAATCSCKCFLTAEDCTGSTPNLDPDNCKCYCQYQSPYGACPPEKPALNQNCECECAIDDAFCAEFNKVLDPDTCDCKCATDGSECTGGTPDFNSGTCECYCLLSEVQADIDSGKAGSVPCPEGFSVDGATCSCVEDYDAEALDIDLMP
jgi:hypothetical protein